MSEEKGTKSGVSKSATEAIAGFTAGVAVTLVNNPFDVLKTRLQLETGASHLGQSLQILRDIIRNEGGYVALYRGLAINMVGNAVSWSLYFLWYGNAKSTLARIRGQERNLTTLDYFAASGIAGLATSALTNPIWVIKTRMLATGRDSPGAYKGMLDGARSIWRNEGARGFWHGLVPSLFGISHAAVQFAVYEQLKNHRAKALRDDTDTHGIKGQGLSNWDYLVLSASSKVFAASATYPFQVVRARLQNYRSQAAYQGFSHCVNEIWTKEGSRGFYRGLGPSIVRVLPSTCVTFLVYENAKFYVPKVFG